MGAFAGSLQKFLIKADVLAEMAKLLPLFWKPSSQLKMSLGCSLQFCCFSAGSQPVYSVDAICNFYMLSAEMIIGDLGITARVSLTVIIIVWESVFLGNKTKVCVLFIHSVNHIRCNVLETSVEVVLPLLVYKTVERNRHVVSPLTVPQIFYWCSPVVTRKSASSWITATFWW